MIDKAYVYIVECKDGTLYTGWTKNIEARVKVHNSGNGAKYTRSRLPVNLVFWEELETKSEALIREAAIKKMTRKQKLILINGLDKQERGR
ncbi:GIY-YIG nuclease family protein [Acetobacterium paludosum]|uniref:GIY-YIG nuclease family protein n=1 Tax=Acetobacterium paludosum TaxID=52693 RepID=UPI00164C4C29|nr:GIY-YIG nuclease family protein [Acetobacterium paludosum]